MENNPSLRAKRPGYAEAKLQLRPGESNPGFFVHWIASSLTLLAMTVALFFPYPAFPETTADARAQALYRQVHCMVCTGQSLAESDAELAKNMRALIREKIAAGESDDAILHYLTERYGDGILLEPPVNRQTWLLWAGPFALLLMGFLLAAGKVFMKKTQN